MSNIIAQRYECIKELGKGAMGEVYLCRDKVNADLEVALKKIPHDCISETSELVLKNEFEVMCRLTHPNVCNVYDLGFDHDENFYFITMEYLNGVSLQKHYEGTTNDNSSRYLDDLVDLARALDFIHSRNVIHRDINPNNIMVCDNTLKLMDFGLADYEKGRPVGTLPYMAPEIFTGLCSFESDLFALGMSFYELISGKPFYDEINLIPSIVKNETKYNSLKSERLKNIHDESLRSIIENMIAYYPEMRYHSGASLTVQINRQCKQNYPLESPKSKMAYVYGVDFIGRAHELKRLKHHLKATDGTLLWITGEAGVGKSRLFTELKKYCQLNGEMFIEGQCFEDNTPQFKPILDIVNGLIPYLDESLLEIYGAQLKKRIPNSSYLQKYTTAPTEDPKTEYRLMIKVLSSCIVEGAQKTHCKIALYINDIQWIDKGSMAVLDTIVGKSVHYAEKGVVVPALYVSSRIHQNHESLGKNSIYVKWLHLVSFSQKDTDVYIESVFGKNSVGHSLMSNTAILNRRSGGNPFYLQEIIRQLIYNNSIERRENKWELTNNNFEDTIPITLSELIHSRLKTLKLSKEQSTLLESMAIINAPIPYATLNAITPLENSVLFELCELEIIRSDEKQGMTYFSIAHDLLASVITKSLHRPEEHYYNVAVALENIYADEKEHYAEELVRLYLLSENHDKSIEYLEYAIKKTTKENNISMLEFYLNKELDLLNSSKEERLLYIETSIKKRFLLYDMGKIEESNDCCKDALKYAEEIDDLKSVARLKRAWGAGLIRLGDPQGIGIQMLKESADLFDQLEEYPMLAAAYNTIGLYYLKVHTNADEASPYFEKGLALGEKCESDNAICYNLGNLSDVAFHKGDFNTAIEYNKKAFHYIQKMGLKSYVQLNYLYQARYYFYAGNFDDALHYISKQIVVAKEISNIGSLVLGYCRKAEIYFVQKLFHEASDTLKEGAPYLDDIDDHEALFSYILLKSKTNYAMGNKIEAIHQCEELLKEYASEEFQGKALYELWIMTEDEGYRDRALCHYKNLYSTSNYFEHTQRYHELQNGVIKNNYYQETVEDNNTLEEVLEEDSYDDGSSPEFTQWLERIKSKEEHVTSELNEIIAKSIKKHLHKSFVEFNREVYSYQKTHHKKANLAKAIKENLFVSELLNSIADINSNLSRDIMLKKILKKSLYFLQAERGAILFKNKNNEFEVSIAINSDDSEIDDITVSTTVIEKVLTTNRALFIPDLIDSSPFALSQSITEMQLRSIMCAPIFSISENHNSYDDRHLMGLIYLDSREYTSNDTFTENSLSLLEALAGHTAVAIHNAFLTEELQQTIIDKENAELEVRKLNSTLEEKIKQRTEQLENAQQEIADNAYKSGMSETATHVLHNVGNVLNSIKTSTQMLSSILGDSKISKLEHANKSLKKNSHIVSTIPKGGKLIDYYFLIEKLLKEETESLGYHIDRLREKTSMIENILDTQNDLAHSEKIVTADLNKTINDVLLKFNDSFVIGGVTVDTDFNKIPLVNVHKFKLIYALTTLCKRSIAMFSESQSHIKKISIKTSFFNDKVKFTYKDSATFLTLSEIKNLFKPQYEQIDLQSPYELHTMANYINSMGGTIKAYPHDDSSTSFIILLQSNNG